MKYIRALMTVYNPYGLDRSQILFTVYKKDKLELDRETGGSLGVYASETMVAEAAINMLPADKRLDFLYDVRRVRKMLAVGDEWAPAIINLILRRYFYPPSENATIIEESSGRDAPNLTIRVNPDTSIDDIRAIWKELRAAQKRLWPNYKAMKLDKRSLQAFEIWAAEARIREDNKNVKDMDVVANIWGDSEDISQIEDKKRRSRLKKIRSRGNRR